MHIKQLPLKVISGTGPELRFQETDQVDPKGRWRYRIDADKYYFERALTADWATFEEWLMFSKVDEAILFRKRSNHLDDLAHEWGTSSDAGFLWETADANANELILSLPAGGAVNVPVLAIGVGTTATPSGIVNRDLGFFNGITEPRLAVVDLDYDSWIALGFNADDDARIMIGGSAALTLPAISGTLDVNASVDIDLDAAGENLAFDKTFTAAGAIDEGDITVTRNITGGALNLAGALVNITDNSTTTGTNTSILLQLGSGTPGRAPRGLYIGNLVNEIDGRTYFDGGVDFGAGQALTMNSCNIYGIATWVDNSLRFADDIQLRFGGVVNFQFETADANANLLLLSLPEGGAVDVPILMIGDTSIINIDLGIADGITQPGIITVEKAGKYTSSSTGTALVASPSTLTEAGKFTSSLIGDVVRIVSGTNVTAGWYWITTVTDANNVILDRNFCAADTTDITYLIYHSFTMLSADGLCTRITDGAPDDTSVELDRDGWLILDVSQANGRLYWRANNAWHYVNATAGFEIPTSEIACPKCRKDILVGEAVGGIINERLTDNALHGRWCHLECLASRRSGP